MNTENEFSDFLNAMDYDIKQGDIKVDSHELKTMLNLFEKCLSMLPDPAPGSADESFQEKASEYDYFFRKKYLVLGEMRNHQQTWYKFLKKAEIMPGIEYQQREELKTLYLAHYIDFKTKRENISKEVKQLELKYKDFEVD